MDEYIEIDISIIEPYNILENNINLTLVNANQINYDKWLSYLEQIDIIYFVVYGDISNFKIPDGVKYAYLDNLNIKNLDISLNLERLICNHNKIKKLYIPDNLIEVEVTFNKLKLVQTIGNDPKLSILLADNNPNIKIEINITKYLSYVTTDVNAKVSFELAKFMSDSADGLLSF